MKKRDTIALSTDDYYGFGECAEGREGDNYDAGSSVGHYGSLNWADSGKLLVLSKLLPLWKQEGHKVLIFSQTRSMLHLIERMVQQFSFRYLRLDGNTPVSARQSMINHFNESSERGGEDIFIMLLTTRTGGVGISLVAANRVVLVDPDWYD